MRTETTTHEDGSRTTYTYDRHDRHIRTTDYNEDGAPIYDIHYHFDEHDRPAGWAVFDGQGRTVRRFELRYGGDDSQEIREYGPDGALLTRTLETFNADGGLLRQVYNADDELIAETTLGA